MIIQLATIFWMFTHVADESEQRLMRSVACRLRDLLEPHLTPAIDYEAAASLIDSFYAANPKMRILFLDQAGNILGSYGSRTTIGLLPSISTEAIELFLRAGANGDYPIYGPDPEHPHRETIFSACAVNLGGQPGYLYAILTTETARSVYRMAAEDVVALTGVLAILGSIAAGAVVGWRMLSYLRFRLDDLFSTVRRFANHEYSARVPIPIHDEIGELSGTINSMAEAIEENVQQIEQRDALRREIVADVSHDLRGPVTGIKGHLGLLEMMPPQRVAERISDILPALAVSCDALENLLNELFELAKLEAREREPNFEVCDLADLCRSCVLRCLGIAESKGVELKSSLPEGPVAVSIDRNMLLRAIGNLLENAIYYTPSERSVTIRLAANGDGALVEIEDQGVGIAEDDAERLFGRFVQGQSSAKSSGKSSGLGLAIVKRILELHQSKPQVRSAPGQGTVFYFSLPLDQA